MMELHDIVPGAAADDYRVVTLRTDRGDIECRHYAVPGARWSPRGLF